MLAHTLSASIMVCGVGGCWFGEDLGGSLSGYQSNGTSKGTFTYGGIVQILRSKGSDEHCNERPAYGTCKAKEVAFARLCS